MIKNRKWNVGDRDTDREAAEKIAAALGIEYITAKLLCARGYRTPEEANSFIRLETELFPDPFLMKDMDLATDRILSAINNGEKMTVYGDYDVDGVTSTALLRLWLTENGGDADYYIPSRAGEGYGVNREAVGKLAELRHKADNHGRYRNNRCFRDGICKGTRMRCCHNRPSRVPRSSSVCLRGGQSEKERLFLSFQRACRSRRCLQAGDRA